MRKALYRYAKWADEQTDDLDEPMLLSFGKFFFLQMIPMMVIMAATFVVGIFLVSLLWKAVPWIWDLVWI